MRLGDVEPKRSWKLLKRVVSDARAVAIRIWEGGEPSSKLLGLQEWLNGFHETMKLCSFWGHSRYALLRLGEPSHPTFHWRVSSPAVSSSWLFLCIGLVLKMQTHLLGSSGRLAFALSRSGHLSPFTSAVIDDIYVLVIPWVPKAKLNMAFKWENMHWYELFFESFCAHWSSSGNQTIQSG